MAKLKWQRITDSDGTTIMYTAVAGQPEPRQPYLSYRAYPEGNGTGTRVIGYSVSLWHPFDGDMEWIGSACMGSDDYETRYGEYTLADAKRAAQDHHNQTQTMSTPIGTTRTSGSTSSPTTSRDRRTQWHLN